MLFLWVRGVTKATRWRCGQVLEVDISTYDATAILCHVDADMAWLSPVSTLELGEDTVLRCNLSQDLSIFTVPLPHTLIHTQYIL
jgi:hypothetical protein